MTTSNIIQSPAATDRQLSLWQVANRLTLCWTKRICWRRLVFFCASSFTQDSPCRARKASHRSHLWLWHALYDNWSPLLIELTLLQASQQQEWCACFALTVQITICLIASQVTLPRFLVVVGGERVLGAIQASAKVEVWCCCGKMHHITR